VAAVTNTRFPRIFSTANNPDTNQLFLRVWEDQLTIIEGVECILILKTDWEGTSPGFPERQEHVGALRRGAEGCGVLCTAKDIQGPRREIATFDRETLLRFGDLIDVDSWVYASVIERIPADDLATPKGGSEWTQVEVEASVDAYLEMLRKEERGEKDSKAAYNAELREGPLVGRTRASVEYRMQNISAVLEDLGLNRIQGYLPAKNVGPKVSAQIISVLGSRRHLDPDDYEPTSDESDLEERTRKLKAKGFAAPPKGTDTPPTTAGSHTVFLRSAAVRAWVLKTADGVCELCRRNAPFLDSHGDPFLEVHHVVPLGDGGPDSPNNAVAICPNCHRRCHYAQDASKARETLHVRVGRLQPH